MIKIASSVKLSFMFPGSWETAFEFYSDFPRMVEHLRHIDLVPADSSTGSEYRLWYHTTELGRYHIHVYCDIRMELDPENRTIEIVPIQNFPPIETKVTINSTATRGNFGSTGRFFPAGDETRIEYVLRLDAKPPKPKGMRFVPGRIVDSVAQNITSNRVKEIAEGFISHSIQAFPEWYDAQRDAHGADA